MSNKIIVILFSFIILVFFPACIENVTEKEKEDEKPLLRKEVTITTFPDNAKIYLGFEKLGLSNLETTIEQPDDKTKMITCTIKKPGYKYYKFEINLEDSVRHYNIKLIKGLDLEFNEDSSVLVIGKNKLDLKFVSFPEINGVNDNKHFKSYYGMYEITEGQWKYFIYSKNKTREEYPIVNISRKEIFEFCDLLSLAAGISISPLSLKDYLVLTQNYIEPPDKTNSWFFDNWDAKLKKAGTKKSLSKPEYATTPIYDIYGNAAEWVADFPSESKTIYKDGKVVKYISRRKKSRVDVYKTHHSYYAKFFGGSFNSGRSELGVDSISTNPYFPKGINIKTSKTEISDYKSPEIGFRVMLQLEK